MPTIILKDTDYWPLYDSLAFYRPLAAQHNLDDFNQQFGTSFTRSELRAKLRAAVRHDADMEGKKYYSLEI
ncbi:MAG: hypothetical protein M1814_004601 [Vezdaea aestivalis]|nr:MAG: hypothetical protein M1814_004601 [Vezdaea aestivalis]